MTVVPVDSAERVRETTAILTLAFCDDPVTRWLYPGPALVLDAFPRLVAAFSRFGFDAGSVRMTEDRCGAAVWLPPGVHVDEDAIGPIVEHDFDPAVRSAAEDFFGAMDSYHPDVDHWHLPLLGVEPGRRGQGRGSALLEEALRRVDDEHAVAYLESTNPRNVPLYKRFGFEPLGRIQVGDSPEMVPMLREPR